MQLQPWGERAGGAEAGEQLPKPTARELEVDEHVVGRRDGNGRARQRPPAHHALGLSNGAHGLHPAHRPHQGGHAVQPVDAVVDHGTHAGSVERCRIAGVLPPRSRPRVGVVGDRERQPAVPMRGDDLAQPLEPARRGCCRRAEQEHAAIGSGLDQPICLRDG